MSDYDYLLDPADAGLINDWAEQVDARRGTSDRMARLSVHAAAQIAQTRVLADIADSLVRIADALDHRTDDREAN